MKENFHYEILPILVDNKFDYHVHFQCSFGVQRDSADIADVLSLVVGVFVCLQSCHILKFLLAVGEKGRDDSKTSIKSTLK